MGSKHAICSPSGASGWLKCPGWQGNSGSSKYSRLGTAAHELAAGCLIEGRNAIDALGVIIEVEGDKIIVDKDMCDAVQVYVDLVRDLGGTLYVEQKLSIEHITGEKGAEGTSDAVVLFPDEICVVDYKHGQGVGVNAEENEQLQIYALAALEEFGIVSQFKTARLIIVQPRTNNISEWSLPVSDLIEFGKKATQAAQAKLSGSTELYPSEDGCRWCSKKPSCPALSASISKTIGADFDDLSVTAPAIPVPTSPDALAAKMAAVPLIENWLKAIRAEVERQLLQGNPVPGYKLVRGKAGNRKWSDEKEVEAALKAMRLRIDEMYDLSVISPTTAEKLFKENPRQWAKLECMVTRSEGKLSVSTLDDKRPAVNISDIQSGFEVVEDDID